MVVSHVLLLRPAHLWWLGVSDAAGPRDQGRRRKSLRVFDGDTLVDVVRWPASMNSAEACTRTTAAVHSTRSRSMSYRRSRPGVRSGASGAAAGDAGEGIGGVLLAAGLCGGRVRRFPLPGYGVPTTT